MTARTMMTAEEFDRLPLEEGRRLELLDGELIEIASATPLHNRIQIRFAFYLEGLLDSTGFGCTLPETEFALGSTRRLKPDIAVLSAEQWEQIDVEKVPVNIAPVMVCEVISPSESGKELESKVSAYLAAGVREVIQIYPWSQHVYLHTEAGITRLGAGDTLRSSVVPGLEVPIDRLFAGVKR